MDLKIYEIALKTETQVWVSLMPELTSEKERPDQFVAFQLYNQFRPCIFYYKNEGREGERCTELGRSKKGGERYAE